MLEENSQDMVYYFKKAGLLQKINISLKTHIHGGSNNMRTEHFWKQVDEKFKKDLHQDWAYKHDFEMLGFDIQNI